MNKYNFTLTKKEMMDYSNKYGYAQMMFVASGDDYVASRCLIMNNLFSGFPLYSQSVEKMLKAFIFLETEKRTNLKNKDKHNPYLLKEELKDINDYGLDKYNKLLKKLYGHFQGRYFDNKDKSKSKGGDELNGFDELWVKLLQKIPFPIEVRYRLKFFANLFDKNYLKYLPEYKFWATENNNFLTKSKIKEMEKDYFEVAKYRDSI